MVAAALESEPTALSRILSRSSLGTTESAAWLAPSSGDRYLNITDFTTWAITPLGSALLPSIKVANVLLPPGKWVYEVRIAENNAGQDAYAVLGWATPSFFGDCARGLGVGDDEHSVGLSGSFQDGFSIKFGSQVGNQLHRGYTTTTGSGIHGETT